MQVNKIDPSVIPQAGTPEYQEFMVNLYDNQKVDTTVSSFAPETEAAQQTPVEKPARPDHIPEKFWDAEAGQVRVDELLKSYTELEKSRSKSAEQTKADEQKAEGDQQNPEDKPKGIDWDALGDKVLNKGLEESDYEQLESAGIPKEIVDSYLSLIDTARSAASNRAAEYAGSKETLDSMLNWAAANLNDAEKAAYNARLASPDWQMAIDSLKLRMGSSNGSHEPTLINGNNVTNGDVGYQSKAEMIRDMSDPRYTSDPAFRRQVTNKIRLANF